MSTTGGKIIWELDAETDKLKSGLDEARNEADKTSGHFSKTASSISGSMKGIGATMTAAVTAPIVAGGLAALKSAADYEQLNVSFATMLGSGEKAKKLLGELNEFAAKTPFQTEDVNKSARSLLAYGVSADRVKDVLRTIGDVSAGTNVPLTEMADLFGKMKSGGIVMTEDLNQLAGRGIPILDILSKKYGVTTLELRKMASESKIPFKDIEEAFASMSGKGGIFFDLMNKQSTTAAGQFSTLQDSIALVARQFGEALLPMAVRVMASISGLVSWIGTMDKGTRDVVLRVVALVAAAGPLLIILGMIVGAVSSAAAALAALPLVPIAIAVGVVSLAVAAFIKHMGGMEAAGQRVGQIMTQLGNVYNTILKPAIDFLWKNISENLVPALQKLWEQLAPVLIPTLKAVAIIVGGVVVAAIFALVAILNVVVAGFSLVINIITAFLGVLKSIKGAVDGAMAGVYDGLVGPFKKAFDWIKNAVAETVNKLKDLSPFTKHSPSLVEQVTKGVGIIQDQYNRLTGINLPSLQYEGVSPRAAGGAEDTNPRMGANVSVHIGQVNDNGDVEKVAREIGFRLAIA